MYKMKTSVKIWKWVKNALLSPFWVVGKGVYGFFWSLEMITAGPLRIMASIALIANIVCWFIGKQDFGQFSLILIPIAIAVVLPFGFGWVAIRFNNISKRINRYWNIKPLASEPINLNEQSNNTALLDSKTAKKEAKQRAKRVNENIKEENVYGTKETQYYKNCLFSMTMNVIENQKKNNVG